MGKNPKRNNCTFQSLFVNCKRKPEKGARVAKSKKCHFSFSLALQQVEIRNFYNKKEITKETLIS
jgi:hypothetical protein